MALTKTHLAWKAAANDVLFNVYRNGTKIASAIPGTPGTGAEVGKLTYDDPYAGLEPGSYTYDVSGLNGDGAESGVSNVASATVPFPAPGIPTDLVATAA